MRTRSSNNGGPYLVLVRGLPGSGKTTLARSMKGYVLLEADMYFERSGTYLFDESKLQEAHQWCLSEVAAILQKGANVVVANTFVTHREMRPYIELGYPTTVLEAKGQFASIHRVSESVIEAMRSAWEDVPTHVPLTTPN